MRTNPDIWKECIDCKGLCCRWEHVIISKKEIQRIAKFTRKKDFYFKRKGYLFLRKKPNGYCIFYNKKNHRCSIYKAKPFDCSLFPFDIVEIKGKYMWAVWMFCPIAKKIMKNKEKSKTFLKSLKIVEKNLKKHMTKQQLKKYANYIEPAKEKYKRWQILREMKF